MRKPLEVALIGAGNRGYRAFGQYALRYPDRLKVVAVAEPDPVKRARFACAHEIPADNVFHRWESMMQRPQLSMALINTTMDRIHLDSTLAALEVGYHVLLEKPMAASARDCMRIVDAAENAGRVLQICHVLRYTPFFLKLKELVESGSLGDLVSIEHTEHVAYWHMAHSYVRGNWRNADHATPMLLSKSCHDLDILIWMIGSRCERVASFGTLRHFKPENAPLGAPPRCMDGCPAEAKCPYYAPRLYLGMLSDTFGEVISIDPSKESRLQALAEGPYGRCVYLSDNNVVDHQTTIMEFEDGITVSFTMQGHSHDNVRTMRYSGTRGTLRGHTGMNELTVHDYLSGGETLFTPGLTQGGHGGGDWGIIQAFTDALKGQRHPATSASNTLESHLIAYAIEQSRNTGEVVEMDTFKRHLYDNARTIIST